MPLVRTPQQALQLLYIQTAAFSPNCNLFFQEYSYVLASIFTRACRRKCCSCRTLHKHESRLTKHPDSGRAVLMFVHNVIMISSDWEAESVEFFSWCRQLNSSQVGQRWCHCLYITGTCLLLYWWSWKKVIPTGIGRDYWWIYQSYTDAIDFPASFVNGPVLLFKLTVWDQHVLKYLWVLPEKTVLLILVNLWLFVSKTSPNPKYPKTPPPKPQPQNNDQ